MLYPCPWCGQPKESPIHYCDSCGGLPAHQDDAIKFGASNGSAQITPRLISAHEMEYNVTYYATYWSFRTGKFSASRVSTYPIGTLSISVVLIDRDDGDYYWWDREMVAKKMQEDQRFVT